MTEHDQIIGRLDSIERNGEQRGRQIRSLYNRVSALETRWYWIAGLAFIGSLTGDVLGTLLGLH